MSSSLANRAEIYVHFFQVFWTVADQRCKDYVGTSKPHGQAASLESCVIFFDEIQRRGLGGDDVMVIDAGAGASSAILRTYFKNVISCDPDAQYLRNVQMACEAMGLGHGGWVHGIPSVTADHCFYDYGAIERKPSLKTFFDKTRHVFYLDDAHDDDLVSWARKTVGNVLITRGSLDEHGRFGAFLD